MAEFLNPSNAREHRPASTAVYVPQLVDPAFLLEVEAVAIKTAP